VDIPVLAGRYELGEVLGHGGVLDRAVAVKLFRSDAAVPDLAGRYEQEARLLASLSHPGLVTIFDAGVDASAPERPQPYLVMELVEGPTLARRLADGSIPAAQVASLGAELAAALAYVHRRGVVHRDVKPANILLTDGADGAAVTARLTDFGIARLVDSTRMTMHGLTLGTPNYLSPEQAIGGEVAAPTDVYALGLVLLECCTGQIVYPGHGVEAAVVRLHRPPDFPSWLGPQWSHLLIAMTHPDPAQRPSAAQVSTALSTLAQAPDPGATLAGAPTQALPVAAFGASTQLLRPAAVRGPLRWSWVAAAVVLAALVVVVALIATHHSSAPATGRPPAYPSVPGQLGTDLQQLQRQVQP